MTLLIDPRAGSIDLYRPLRALSLPVRKHRMPFGDVAFTGSGPAGEVSIGVEYKRLSDFLSCMTDKRLLTHQLPGLVKAYGIVIILVEGAIRPTTDSGLESLHQFTSRKGSDLATFRRVHAHITYPQLAKHIFTLMFKGRIHVHFTSSFPDTIGYLSALYTWWQKPWGLHTSHLALPAWDDSGGGVIFRAPSEFRRFVSALPGVGLRRSSSIAKHFQGSPWAMFKAQKTEWSEILTVGVSGKKQRLGPARADVIYRFLHRRPKPGRW